MIVLSGSSPALAAETVLSTGTADASGSQGAKWRRVDFVVPQTAPSTLTLSWTGTADMRFAVFESSTNTKIGANLTAANPKSVTLNLQAGIAYHSGIWAYSGVGNYVFTLGQPGPEPPPPGGRPNIILINTDDQRADTIQYLPKLRRWLVDGGTNFTNGYVSTPSCCPSRATLMSGRYVHNNGQYNQQTLGFNLNLTTQRYLHDAGYLTGHAGKFLHWLGLSEEAPHFDRWTYFKGGYNDVYMNFDGTIRRSQGYSTIITFDRAIAYINDFEARNDSKPFYLSLAPIAPHSPSIAEARYATAPVPAYRPDPSYQEADRSDKPQWVRNRNVDPATAEALRTSMIRTLYTLDDQIDRLMQHLQVTGELGNTMVILTSDNGYMWGEHKLSSKFMPYRPAVEVPFLIRWPGHVPAGATDSRFVTHVDIAPTILAAAGVTQNYMPFDGRNIFSGDSRTQAFTEYYHDLGNSRYIPSWASIRTSGYQYVEYYDITNPRLVVFREYYDMQADPYQLVNLYADGNPANDPAVAPLSTQLQAARQCSGTSCP
ncbi:MAG TPA: sulfatase [Micromonosporaceae bacterium]|nr:sulfatase [Micromonosporaceae bacterium]